MIRTEDLTDPPGPPGRLRPAPPLPTLDADQAHTLPAARRYADLDPAHVQSRIDAHRADLLTRLTTLRL